MLLANVRQWMVPTKSRDSLSLSSMKDILEHTPFFRPELSLKTDWSCFLLQVLLFSHERAHGQCIGQVYKGASVKA